MTNRELKIACRCHVEALHLLVQFEGETDVYISRWVQAGYDGPQPWKWRLWHIWRIVRRGTPYEDDIVLSADDARKLGQFLLPGATVESFKNGVPYLGSYKITYTTSSVSGGGA